MSLVLDTTELVRQNLNSVLCKYLSIDLYNQFYSLAASPHIDNGLPFIQAWSHPSITEPSYSYLAGLEYTLAECQQCISDYEKYRGDI